MNDNPKIAPLMKNLDNFSNIGALQFLINHEEIIEVSENNKISFISNGKELSMNIDDYKYNGASLVSKKYDEKIKSVKNVCEAIISSNQFYDIFGKKATTIGTTAHELYGHLFLFLWQSIGWSPPRWDSHKGTTFEHLKKIDDNIIK